MFCNYCGEPNPDVAAFCNKCGKPLAQTPASAPVQLTDAQLIASALETPPVAASSPPAPVVFLPGKQEASAPIGGTLSPAARIEFTDGLTAEVRRQIDNKCIPAGIVAWIITMIAVARFSVPEFGTQTGVVIALVVAFVIAGGIVFNVAKNILENKYLRPIANLSDEMLVNRYNEAKADRRAARTRTAIGWAVIAIVVVVLIIAWLAAQRH
ncbi:MAG: zinc ribbon domain-containing protein [Candidatus Acidiferrales bacterium]